MYQVVNSRWICAAKANGEMVVFNVDRVISVQDDGNGSLLCLETCAIPNYVHLRMTATQFFETVVKDKT